MSQPPKLARHFNPLPPCGGRRHRCFPASSVPDFNPLPPCGGRLDATTAADLDRWISIHSLRVEGDLSATPEFVKCVYFNPLPPCGGRRRASGGSGARSQHFNPLPPCGGRLFKIIFPILTHHFNPLPPCGGRLHLQPFFSAASRFQSTPSVWRETGKLKDFTLMLDISIHSLRVEGDKGFGFFDATSDISIHSLRVEGDGHP